MELPVCVRVPNAGENFSPSLAGGVHMLHSPVPRAKKKCRGQTRTGTLEKNKPSDTNLSSQLVATKDFIYVMRIRRKYGIIGYEKLRIRR